MKGLKYIMSVLFVVFALNVTAQETKMVKNRKKMLEKQEQEKKKG